MGWGRGATAAVLLAAEPVAGNARALSCSRPIGVGSRIMDWAVASSAVHSVRLTRGGADVACGTALSCVDRALGVRFNGTFAAGQLEYVIEVEGGAISDGDCASTRLINQESQSITLPSGEGTLHLRAAWSTGARVWVTPDCTYPVEACEGASSNGEWCHDMRDHSDHRCAVLTSALHAAESTASTPVTTPAPSSTSSSEGILPSFTVASLLSLLTALVLGQGGY